MFRPGDRIVFIGKESLYYNDKIVKTYARFTKNRSYVIVHLSQGFAFPVEVWVIDNKGYGCWINQGLFISLKEYRKQKINKILCQ